MCIKERIQEYKQSLLNWSLFDGKKTLLLMLLSLLFFYPILYGHGIYLDDTYRIENGQFLWATQGRFFAELIAKVFSLSKSSVIDPTPYNWIFCIITVGLCSKLIYLRFAKENKSVGFIIAALFIINPYFIQNILFRFDGPGMALALFFAVFAYCINSRYFVIKTILLVISMNFYQPIVNIFIGLLAIEVMLMFQNKVIVDQVVRFIVKYMLIFGVSALIYYFEIKVVQLITPLNGMGRGAMLPISLSLPKELLLNLCHGLEPYLTFWKSYILYIFPLILVAFVSIVRVVFIGRDYRLFLGYIISLLLMLFSVLGLMVLMEYQSYIANVRVYTYFPITIILLTLIAMHYKPIFKWSLIPILLVCFIFSARVGNLLQIQAEFEKPIFYELSEDLNTIQLNENIGEFYSLGTVPYSNFVKNIMYNTPFNGYLNRYGVITRWALQEYDGKLIKVQSFSEANLEKIRFKKIKDKLELVLQRKYYSVYINNKGEGWIIWSSL